MMLGLSLDTFTLLHTIIGLIGIVSGAAVVVAMLGARTAEGLNVLFLLSTVLTSVTGFMFPFNGVLDSHVVGAVSLAVLAVALLARYGFRLRAAWRWIYVVTALLALYLNVFVGVVQAFQKVAVLNRLAPARSDPAFIAVQVAVAAIFLWLGALALRRFHPARG
jgi:hypothetical protein